MTDKVLPFLMFQGRAEEAIRHYVSVIPKSEIVELSHWPAGGPGKEGSVMRALVSLGGQRAIVFDSPSPHAFTFTPSISFFITCESETEIERLARDLWDGVTVLMPLGNYGFSRKFAWVQDAFGVSWQLNLP
jgi:predicted 3-demethylubiquinone-9 3-methyltransferase (glyoxalase superfamily)